MAFAGLALSLLGFIIAFSSLGVTSSTGVRLVMALVGVAVSLAGSLGLVNQAYMKDAIWKK
jgi:hypothetical protein